MPMFRAGAVQWRLVCEEEVNTVSCVLSWAHAESRLPLHSVFDQDSWNLHVSVRLQDAWVSMRSLTMFVFWGQIQPDICLVILCSNRTLWGPFLSVTQSVYCWAHLNSENHSCSEISNSKCRRLSGGHRARSWSQPSECVRPMGNIPFIEYAEGQSEAEGTSEACPLIRNPF